ncbi:MAG: hypothetical protein E7063_07590 [Spirochaetaceae bacterium]|nr:hypothetical protein [Spirochaetaceae bacterium]
MTQSQRVIQMKKGFMQLHEDGKSISEIAEVYHLHPRTVYSYLQEIADSNNVTRESLLPVVHKPHEMKNSTVRKCYDDDAFDIKEVQASFASAITSVSNVIKKIDNILDNER